MKQCRLSDFFQRGHPPSILTVGFIRIYVYTCSLVPRPSLTAFFAAVEKSVGKAWKQTSRDACHRFRHNKGSWVHLYS